MHLLQDSTNSLSCLPMAMTQRSKGSRASTLRPPMALSSTSYHKGARFLVWEVWWTSPNWVGREFQSTNNQRPWPITSSRPQRVWLEARTHAWQIQLLRGCRRRNQIINWALEMLNKQRMTFQGNRCHECQNHTGRGSLRWLLIIRRSSARKKLPNFLWLSKI